MKKLLTLAFMLIVAASLLAQDTGGDKNKTGKTTKTTATSTSSSGKKSHTKGHKGGKKGKKSSGGTTTPAPK